MKDFKLGVIGFGNMANAILSGAIKSGVCRHNEICVYDIESDKVNHASSEGFAVAGDLSEVTNNCRYVLLSVKPQSAGDVFNAVKDSLNNNIFISIMAGVTKQKIHNSLPSVKVCRCMPNTPALIGKGITAIDASEIENSDKDFIINLFNSIGNTIETDEKDMNAVTAVSGSGPAFVYKFIDAFISAAQNIGLNREQAETLVLHTVTGAAEMVKQSEIELDQLIDKVCSKGGTTIEGMNVLNKQNLSGIINDCVKAAYLRAEELSKL